LPRIVTSNGGPAARLVADRAEKMSRKPATQRYDPDRPFNGDLGKKAR
jgi:antitoxin (DNA-binding transcriptional repressor) of toxin-antitoxin stability system